MGLMLLKSPNHGHSGNYCRDCLTWCAMVTVIFGICGCYRSTATYSKINSTVLCQELARLEALLWAPPHASSRSPSQDVHRQDGCH